MVNGRNNVPVAAPDQAGGRSLKVPFSLLEQGQHGLRQLVGLGQHGGTSLLQNLATAQIGGFCRVVRIHDAAAGGFRVLDLGA